MPSDLPRRFRLPGWTGALCRPWAWILLAALAVASPIFASPGMREPFGRPWYLGRLLVLISFLILALVLSRSGPGAAPPAASAQRRCWAILVFLLSYTAFVANYRTISAGDNLPTRALPQALLNGDGFDLSAVVPEPLHGHYSLTNIDGTLQSAFPVGTGLLVTPYTALTRLLSRRATEIEGSMAALFEKHAGSLLSALAITLLFLGAGELATTQGRRAALVFAVATGTPVLSAVSQGLWSQTGELFLVALALFALSRPGTGVAADVAGGLAMGAAFLCRPTAVLLIPAVLCAAHRRARALPRFLLGFAVSGGAAMALNWSLARHPLGAYARLNAASTVWNLNGLGDRLVGVLFSPSRGLAWFFPALIFAAGFAAVAWRRLPTNQRITTLVSVATVGVYCVLTASYMNWWGGYSPGPRLLAELALPTLLLCSIVFAAGAIGTRSILAALLILQSAIHFRISSFELALDWNEIVQVDRGGEALTSVRQGLLAAAFVPGWEYNPPEIPYFATSRSRSRGDRWQPVNFAAVANADYADARASRPESALWHLHLPRLAGQSAATAEISGLRFLPPGQPNMIQLCAGEVVDIALPAGSAFRRLSTILSWRGTASPDRPVGGLTLIRADGKRRALTLRLGREVFDPASEIAPPVRRIVAGAPRDADELVKTIVPLGRRRAAFRAMRWSGPGARDAGCLHVVAISVQ